MKKRYFTPAVEVVPTEAVGMMALSNKDTLHTDENGSDGSGSLVRQADGGLDIWSKGE